MSENFNRLYEIEKDKKYEALVPYDATSQKGCPQEGIDKYKKWTEEFSFLPTSHFKAFKNPLTVDKNGAQAERRIIMIPLNGHGLLMDKSGQVYRYLFNQNKKDRTRFVDNCPVLEGESFQAWYEWNVKMLKKCYE